tara:strand:- start:1296 stop:1466 length:171 start_codon:yes stop_codon:yes gene_type:complete
MPHFAKHIFHSLLPKQRKKRVPLKVDDFQPKKPISPQEIFGDSIKFKQVKKEKKKK